MILPGRRAPRARPLVPRASLALPILLGALAALLLAKAPGKLLDTVAVPAKDGPGAGSGGDGASRDPEGKGSCGDREATPVLRAELPARSGWPDAHRDPAEQGLAAGRGAEPAALPAPAFPASRDSAARTARRHPPPFAPRAPPAPGPAVS